MSSGSGAWTKFQRYTTRSSQTWRITWVSLDRSSRCPNLRRPIWLVVPLYFLPKQRWSSHLLDKVPDMTSRIQMPGIIWVFLDGGSLCPSLQRPVWPLIRSTKQRAGVPITREPHVCRASVKAVVWRTAWTIRTDISLFISLQNYKHLLPGDVQNQAFGIARFSSSNSDLSVLAYVDHNTEVEIFFMTGGKMRLLTTVTYDTKSELRVQMTPRLLLNQRRSPWALFYGWRWKNKQFLVAWPRYCCKLLSSNC